jgi:PAS domain S-box-containing protein
MYKKNLLKTLIYKEAGSKECGDIFEYINAGVWVIDWLMITVYANSSIAAMLGYSQNEMNGKHLFEFMNEKNVEICKKLFEKRKQGEAEQHEFEFRKKDGSPFYALLQTSPIIDENKKFIGAIASVIDISQKKMSEVELQNKYRNLFENIYNGVVVYEALNDGEDFIIKDLNKACEKIELVERKNLVGKNVLEVFPGLKEFGLYEVFQRVFRTGIPEHHPVSYYSDKRIAGWRENYVYKVSGNEIVAVYEDTTERKHSEESLKQSEELLRTIIDSVPACIFVKDKESRFLVVNDQTAMTYGLDQMKMIGKNDLEIAEKHSGKFSQAKAMMEDDREVVSLKQAKFIPEQTFTSTSGRVRWFQTIKVPLSLKNNPDCVLGISIDISEKRELETEAFKNQKLESIGMLAGGIAHDFNNILTAILNNISLAKAGLKQQDETYDMLGEAETAAGQAKNLTQQLLTFSKGGVPLKKLTGITKLLSDASTFSLRGSNIKSVISIPRDLWALEIDSMQITQVINNLVINAKQAMPTGGKIWITAENYEVKRGEITSFKEGKYVKISVKDQCIGVPAEYISKIFDPYFTTKQEGSGLGLAISYSIIKKHDGYITIESEPGRGTVFYVYLPASGKPLEAEERKSIDILRGSGRILVMDDEELILKVAKRVLEKFGYEVTGTKDGTQAVELYREAMKQGNKFDLVIMDLTIPGGVGGKEAVIELLKIDPAAKVIVSSGYSNDPIMSDYKKHGFCGIAAKPYDIKELSKIVGDVLNKKN